MMDLSSLPPRIFRSLGRGYEAWDRFWFEFQAPRGLAFLRMQLSGIMLWIYGQRLIHSLPWYADEGLVPRASALALMTEPQQPPFGWYILWPDSANGAVHTLFVILLLWIFLGIGTRWVGWLAWIIHMGFIQRNFAVLFGADVISCLFLFYLSFTRCDEALSVRSWWRARSRAGGLDGRRAVSQSPGWGGTVSSLAARLLQVHLAVIYAYTGFEKLKGASWWDGTALWTVLGNPQMVVGDMAWMRNFPLVIAFLTIVTVVFEIYWPVGAFLRRLRPWWLGMGIVFHCGIGFLMGLWPFSLVMLSPYWLFLANDSD